MKSRINYTPKTVLFLSLFVLSLGIFFWSFFSVSQADKEEYAKLVQSANPINSTAEVAPYTAQQQRRAVQKDILFSKGNERLQLCLTSREAIMILDHTVEGVELVEKMRDVKCWMQEEFYYVLPDGREALKQSDGKLLVRGGNPLEPKAWAEANAQGVKPMQTLRYLEADAATYYYKNDQVAAEQVKVSRYTLAGHQLPMNLQNKEPAMRGKAKNVEFSMAGKEINFKATQLKASLFEQRNLQ